MSAWLPGRHAIRSGTQTVDVTGGFVLFACQAAVAVELASHPHGAGVQVDVFRTERAPNLRLKP